MYLRSPALPPSLLPLVFHPTVTLSFHLVCYRQSRINTDLSDPQLIHRTDNGYGANFDPTTELRHYILKFLLCSWSPNYPGDSSPV
ncbi:hypothetical protein GYMLUDRAFT_426179 [Collybiopsis luxurians FD-317 M1]|uniref:Uncharacterized protein n=1 Tax=Collybiopsis luxurians FD-317 M1 TaxID=944289 RepID=A0A0D0CLV5_9AGAR|nr:hypothetical protein GYMLUDRAFT_426179 [Collybiopsis luxurians FD-317 M1]